MPLITLIESGKPYPISLGVSDRNALAQYVTNVWQMPPFTRARMRSPKQQLLRISHKGIQAGGFAGFLWWRDWQIQIFPKVFTSSDTAALVFQHLRWYLSLLPDRDFLMGDMPLQAAQTLSEAYTAQIQAAISTLTHHSSSSTNAGIDFEQYAHQQLPRANWHKLPRKTQQDAHTDLLYLLSQIFSPWRDAQGQSITQRILPPPTPRLRAVATPSLLRTHLSPSAAQVYDLAMQWAQIPEYLRGKFWLLPMARVYERFLTALVRKYFGTADLAAQMSQTLASDAQGKPLMRLRPDWYLPHSHSVVDLKYKLSPREAIHAGISRDDVYQALAYAQSFCAKSAGLVYPARLGEVFTAQKMYLHTPPTHALWLFRLPIAAPNIATLQANLPQHLAQLLAALAQET